MLKKTVAFLLFIISQFSSIAQSDSLSGRSCHLRISLLTCSPGTALYSTFGHSALRLIDSTDSTDIIFNYGTFDFEDPGFYKKFILGKLLYFVSIEEFSDFVMQYEYEGRGIIEQELNLPCDVKEQLLSALFENAKEENKYYKYDFAYDNCTTRLRDMVYGSGNDSFQIKNILPYKNTTFRNLIYEYLDNNHQYWSKLGIDILLGMPFDKKVSNDEAMFLPDYLLKAFDSTTTGNKQLVAGKTTILEPAIHTRKVSLFTPLLVFCLLFLLITGISFFKSSGFRFILRTFDIIFFSLCGMIGLLILFMWLGTEHQACRNNLNLLWALPTHLPAAFLLFKKSLLINKYFCFVFILTITLMIVWFFLPQQMNIALLPVSGIIVLRSLFLCKKSNSQPFSPEKNNKMAGKTEAL